MKFILFDSSFLADVISMQKLEIQNNGASELIPSWSLHIYSISYEISFINSIIFILLNRVLNFE